MTAPSRIVRLRKGLARAAAMAGVLFLSGAVALLLAEGVVRLVAPQQLIIMRPDVWQPAESLGFVHRPNVTARINTGERTVTIRTDAEGYRIAEAGRREASTRVLLLGDSFMEALQVEYEHSAARLLEDRLAASLGTPVAVRNAGMQAWGPNQYLLRGRALLQRDTFALVVVSIFVGNDAVDRRVDYFPAREPAGRKRFRLPRRLSKTEIASALFSPINDALEVRSQLYILAKNGFTTLRMRLGLTGEFFPPTYLKIESDSPRWRLTAEISRDIAEMAARHGAPTLFVLVPEAFQVHEETFHQYVRGYGVDSTTVDINLPTRRLYEEFTGLDLCVVDVLEDYRRAVPVRPRLFGKVDRHFSPAGHELLVELLAPRAAAMISQARQPRPGQDLSRLCP